jgi:Flp pilus assembly protein TadG
MLSQLKMRPKRGSRNRVGSEKGNAFVEFSLCILPLFAMFFGVADISLAVFLKSMLQSSVRDGVRFGITYSTSVNGTSCGSMTACIKQVTRASSLGFLNTSNDSLLKVNYYQPTDLTTPITSGDCDPSGTKTMKNDTQVPARQLRYVNQPGNLIEVSVTDFPWNWMVPLPKFMPGTQLKMSAMATDVLQGLPVGTVTPPAP